MIKNSLLLIAFTFVILRFCFAQMYSQHPKASSVFVVIHVDVMPPFIKPAEALLDTLRNDSLKDKGAKSFKVLQEDSRSNHFTLVEEWADQNAYDAYISNIHTRQFRDKIQPMLGAPLDERIHVELK